MNTNNIIAKVNAELNRMGYSDTQIKKSTDKFISTTNKNTSQTENKK